MSRLRLDATREAQIEGIAAVFGAVVEGRSAIYVSTPLTTGRRLVALRATHESASSHEEAAKDAVRTHVITPNRDDARRFVSMLRSKVGQQVVIDPTGLRDFPGWTQDEYRSLWGRVIERYAGTVVLLDGWEYSEGCVYEFLVAKSSGARTLTARLEPLVDDDGLGSINAAIREFDRLGQPNEFINAVHGELERVLSIRKTP